jgi:salicylate hydroxylase/6-hydroxynicotinate 3-monooxygenase
MTPYMAQGAASALEDAAMLARCIGEVAEPAEAFRRYEATRLERTARLQLTSRANTWGKSAVDPSWVYGYDVWQAPIAPAARVP